VVYRVSLTDVLNPQTLAAYSPNPPSPFPLALLYFITASLIADKQRITEGHIMLKAQSEQIHSKYEYLPVLSVSMSESFCSLNAVLLFFLHKILGTVKVYL
jgi:hypothetical protein